MPRLLLINPSSTYKGLGNVRETSWPPLNLPYLAALTPPHYKIEVLDENIEAFEYQEADLVGITAFTSTVVRAYQIAETYRNKGIPVVMGGIHVSMEPDEALQFCDAVVIGEAEAVWPTVIEDFEAGRLKKRYEGSWLDLETLPMPQRSILKTSHYKWGSIQTSRGCPMDCSFCSVTAFNGRRFRRRPLEPVMRELTQIPQKKIMITDDNIIGYGKQDIEWARSLFSSIIENNIKKIFFAQTTLQFGEDQELIRLAAKAGLKMVFIGMESVNPKTLESYKKNINLRHLKLNRYIELITNIRKAGIAVLGAFIMGSDNDDLSVFHSTLEFIKTAKIDVVQITKPTPLPGTQLWHSFNQEGRITNQQFPLAWQDYRLTKLVFKPKLMTQEEVYKGVTYLRNCYYSIGETIPRIVSTLFTTKSLQATLLAYKFNASYQKAFRDSEHYRLFGQRSLKSFFHPDS